MTPLPQIMRGSTSHARTGSTKHAFSYAVDFVMLDLGAKVRSRLFSINKRNLLAVFDKDHGGPVGDGQGEVWARKIFEDAGLKDTEIVIRLLTQPKMFGRGFNPVSFWFATKGDALLAVIAEVNNTYGDRHSYLCHLPAFAPISIQDTISAKKIFYVSPFQDIDGNYHFNFGLSAEKVSIRIRYDNPENGLIATLSGSFQTLNSARILKLLVRRPLIAFRTITLIHWHAFRLYLKGVEYRPRPTPPKNEVST